MLNPEEIKMQQIVKASQLKKDQRRLAIGIEELDNLIGGLEEGYSYLFYGDQEFIDQLVHWLMVKGTTAGKVAYMNNTDYHTAKTLLDIDRVASYAKVEGVEPIYAMQSIFFAAAYNEFRQPVAAEALAERIKDDFAMLIIHNIDRFLADAKDRRNAFEAMDISISKLWHKAMQNSVIMIITCGAREGKGKLASPSCSSLVKQIARVAVFFRKIQDGAYAASLVKHYEKRVPESVILGDRALGRITPSFRQVYQATLARLRKNYLPLLRSEKEKEAFEMLVREVWDREHAAMANSQLPVVLDAMNLTANLYNSVMISQLFEELRELKMMVEEMKGSTKKSEG